MWLLCSVSSVCPGALMEYATILLLLKKRRRPVVSVDTGLKSVLALVQAGPREENGEPASPQRPQRRKVGNHTFQYQFFLVAITTTKSVNNKVHTTNRCEGLN